MIVHLSIRLFLSFSIVLIINRDDKAVMWLIYDAYIAENDQDNPKIIRHMSWVLIETSYYFEILMKFDDKRISNSTGRFLKEIPKCRNLAIRG